MASIEVKGLDKVQSRLAQLAREFPGRVGAALRGEAELMMTEAKKRTPVDTGALKKSGHATGPHGRGASVYAVLRFGGPSAPYAVYVHENMRAYHKNGRSKFLESVVLEARPYLAQRIAMRLRQQGIVV